MSTLMRTSEIAKRPVVDMAGDDIAQVKDIVYAPGGGTVNGFTLAGRGLFSGPMKTALAWSSVTALGRDAVMVASPDSLGELPADTSTGRRGHGDILGSRVLTDAGTDLGVVVDVIVEVGAGGEPCSVVGYEIKASEALGSAGTTMLIPLPDTMAASGEHLIVPASATDFVQQDLAGFGASIDDFRRQLKGTS
ncbi:MAG: PRC-barrel domain-containing protein [Actinomycetota bacterium]|nr:PRC-barrel domain-containing protein [Actinomycetota bacterium]